MMTRIGIVADDLTGAGDTAVQFVRAGWQTELRLRPAATSEAPSAHVIAVTTDSRNQTAQEAAGSVSAAVKQLRETGVTHLYKKIDSTLRGQIRAEIHAALDGWVPEAVAVVCPAFPAAGRTIANGNLRVNGVDVAKTAVSTDPVTPVTESHIPTMLGASHVGRSSSETVETLAERLNSSGRIVVVDATSEDDLRRLAEALALLGSKTIAVGSAGLARHLASAWRMPAAPAVVLVTSLQDAARRQATAVENAGACRFEPAPNDLVDDRAWARLSAKILDQLDETNSTVLLTAPADRSRGLPAALIPQRFAELTARIIAHRAHRAHATHRQRGRISGVVVTGGDGARALVDALGVSAINLRDEVVTGVPIGTLVGGPADGLAVVTKAGGFGDDNALVQAVESVRYRKFA
jgi:D-threonate/D-erythronate kinase